MVDKGRFHYGGDGGNRTPVRKNINRNLSGRRRSFTFPRPGASRHAPGFSSLMIHGALKALRTHVHHWSTPHPGPWSSRVERSLIKQRGQQADKSCCSLIYKGCPFYGCQAHPPAIPASAPPSKPVHPRIFLLPLPKRDAPAGRERKQIKMNYALTGSG